MIGPDTQEELNALVDEIKSHWFEHIILSQAQSPPSLTFT
jgi:hypothetical protein